MLINIGWQSSFYMILEGQMRATKRVQVSFKIAYLDNLSPLTFSSIPPLDNFTRPKTVDKKWINHINPQLVKTTWSHEEDVELFTNISQLGCKWSLISKNMGRQRTEHMVKNRAKAIIKRHFKKNVKMIENRHLTAVLEALRKKERHFLLQRQGLSGQVGTQKQELPAQSQDQKQQENIESEGHFVDNSNKKSNFVEIDEASYRLVLMQDMDENWQYNEEAHSFDFFSDRQFKYSENLQCPF